MKEVVIVSGVRTAQGKFSGALKEFSAPQLGGIVIKGAVKKAGLKLWLQYPAKHMEE